MPAVGSPLWTTWSLAAPTTVGVISEVLGEMFEDVQEVRESTSPPTLAELEAGLLEVGEVKELRWVEDEDKAEVSGADADELIDDGREGVDTGFEIDDLLVEPGEEEGEAVTVTVTATELLGLVIVAGGGGLPRPSGSFST